MSYRCNHCLYIFNSNKHNCPYCGSRIYFNQTTDEELFLEGFEYEPEYSSNSSGTTTLNDYYAQLQEAYRKEHQSTQSTTTMTYGEQPVNPTINHSSVSGSSNNPVNNSMRSTDNSPSNDFFAQFSNTPSSHSATTVPVIEKPSSTASPALYNSGENDY